MAATVWNGRITFGLVSIPVKVFTATKSHDIHFNLLHEECKNRIRLQYYCPNDERPVERSELVKGYQYEKNRYVVVYEDELEKIKPESSHSLDIEQFVSLSEVDPVYYEKSYYVGPSEKGTEKSFALLATAMQNKQRAAVGRLLMRDHEYLALIRPAMGGLVMQLLNYPDEIRANEHKVPKDVRPREKEVQLAEMLVDNLTEKFDPDRYHNEYIERLEELLDAKIKGRKLTVYKSKPKPQITDLMKALERSVKETSAKKGQGRAEPALPLKNYDKLSVKEIVRKLDDLSPTERRKIRAYEHAHKNRKTILEKTA